jgi:hypothetical protein
MHEDHVLYKECARLKEVAHPYVAEPTGVFEDRLHVCLQVPL